MTASKKERARKDDTRSSPTPGDVTPKLNEERVAHALVEQIEIALGRRPVTVTQINRKTGKVETLERFTLNGLVAVQSIETLFRALQMFDGRLRYQDEDLAPPESQEERIEYLRGIVRQYDERDGPAPADSVVADQQDQDQHQPGDNEAEVFSSTQWRCEARKMARRVSCWSARVRFARRRRPRTGTAF